MNRYFRKTTSRTQKREYARKCEEIRLFCDQHMIDYNDSLTSFYFTIDGQDYRVSNHTVEASNRMARTKDGIYLREEYHPGGRKDNVIYIYASKDRLIQIYKNLEAGLVLNGRGEIR